MASTKRKAAEQEVVDPEHAVSIMPLGAGQEVGRSCIILQYL